jgi:guanylate kinase
MSRPKLFVIASPSGGGKTSILHVILQRHPEFKFSVSATTRSIRVGETNEKEYFFIQRHDFERMIVQGELIEHELIYNDYYGTLKHEVDSALNSGKCMVFDIDVKGATSIKKKYPNDTVLIFIQPPSVEVLEERLRGRKTESEEKLQKRLERAKMEIEAAPKFDHVVVNDVLETAIEEVDAIIKTYL